MTATQSAPATTQASSNPVKTATKIKPPAKKAAPLTVDKAPAPAKASARKAKVSELPVENQIPPFVVRKKKSDKKKVVRDSFSFPEQDYHKISELKKICLSAGVHVKKGEILRAGLHLLTSLKLSELLQAVDKVERVRTGRPKSD